MCGPSLLSLSAYADDVLLQSPSPDDVKDLSETSAVLVDDQYLTPVVEDDPLLRA